MKVHRFTEGIQTKAHLGRFVFLVLAFALLPATLLAKTVVFWQPGFPTVASQPVERSSLLQALNGVEAQFANVEDLNAPATLSGVDLLILPNGSAVPADAWKAIVGYLHEGGNLLILGGQPLRVPVTEAAGKFVEAAPQDTYSRVIDFRHTYEVPVDGNAHFAWRTGYDLPETPQIHARRFFAVEGRLDGLGYMVDSTGLLVAAPVIVADHRAGPMRGSRIVALDFDPDSDYWQSQDGIALIRQSAVYASQGATEFSVETLFSALRPGEAPLITVHLRNPRQDGLGASTGGEVKLTLSSDKEVLDSATLPVTNEGIADIAAPFHQALPPGFYKSPQLIARAAGCGSFIRTASG